MGKLVFYRCEHCGNVAVKLFDKKVPLMCCGEPMKQLVAGSTDAATEKHVPVVERDGNIITVTVGSVEHPMMDAHWITMVVLETATGFAVQNLNPGEEPKASFALLDTEEPLRVYEYCNLHGLWVTEIA